MQPSRAQVSAIDQLVRTIRRKVGQAKDRHRQKTRRLQQIRTPGAATGAGRTTA